jgi:O-antigen/teichoic acid export membrane protein
MFFKFQKFILKFFTEDFLKNFSVLFLGTIFSQFIMLLASLILTRLYSDSDFGYYNIIISIVSIGSVLSTLSYDKSIILSRSNRRYISSVLLCTFLSIFFAIIFAFVGIIIVLFDFSIAAKFKYFDIIFTIPILILSNAFIQILTYSQLRNKQAKTVASLKVAGATLISIFQILASIFKSGFGLVLGHIAGAFVYFMYMVKTLKFISKQRLPFIKSTLSTARYYKNFPRYLFPNEIIDNLSNQLPLLLIGYFTSLATLGQYGLANRILAAPAALLGQAVSQAFFQKISNDILCPSSSLIIMKRIWLSMAIIGVVPFSILFFFGPQLFSFFFGEAWRDAGSIASASALLLFCRFVSSPTSTIYIKMKMQRQGFYFCIFALVYRFFSYLILSLEFSLLLCILIHTVFEVSFIILYNLYAVRKLSNLSRVVI